MQIANIDGFEKFELMLRQFQPYLYEDFPFALIVLLSRWVLFFHQEYTSSPGNLPASERLSKRNSPRLTQSTAPRRWACSHRVVKRDGGEGR